MIIVVKELLTGERIPAGEHNYKMNTFLAEKSQMLYKALPACAGRASTESIRRIPDDRLASEYPVSSTGQAFEQPKTGDFQRLHEMVY